MTRTLVAASIALLTVSSAWSAPGICPKDKPQSNTDIVTYPSGVLAIRTTGLRINTDGADASYAHGDHGFNYIANGVNLYEKDNRVFCYKAVNNRRCREAWFKAEEGEFKKGTPLFEVYGIEGEGFDGKPPEKSKKSGRTLVGDGKGKPTVHKTLTTVTGEPLIVYRSTTSLRHRVNGEKLYLDAATIPHFAATGKKLKLGQIVWIRKPGEKTGVFALVGDTGPADGHPEASIAAHQLLHSGALSSQAPGPIPADQRCQASELNLKPPYTSRPDKTSDTCKLTYNTPKSNTDIRARSPYSGKLHVLALPDAKLKHKSLLIDEEVTAKRLEEVARAAGYTDEKLRKLAQCLE